MVVLFNWKKILRESDNKPSLILDIFEYITYKPIPRNKFDRFYMLSKMDFSGQSFMINPEPITESRRHYGDRELAEYIALASYRNYADYKAMNIKTLDHLMVNITRSEIDNNRLLSLRDGKIHFLWEETAH